MFETSKVTKPENPCNGATDTEKSDEFASKAMVCPVGDAVKANVGGTVPTQFLTALFAFNRPPLTVIPKRLGMTSTESRMVALSSAVLRSHADKIRAAAPDTIAADADVPP
jgi:hypothetical protein